MRSALRQGLEIPRQALNRIVNNCAHLLISIADQILQRILDVA